MFVLRAKFIDDNPSLGRFGPSDQGIDILYSESPQQLNYIVEVELEQSARTLMANGYELLEDADGVIDPSRKPLSPDDVAELLSIAKSTVYKYMNNGKLRAVKDAQTGQYSIPQSAVNEFITATA